MKLLLAVGLLAIVATISAMNIPLKPQAPVSSRTYGNFGPKIKKSVEHFHPQPVEELKAAVDPVAAAVEFFVRKTNTASQPQIASSHTSGHNGVTHVYLQQIVNGLQVVNGVGNVNVGRDGQILSYGSSFYNGVFPAAPKTFSPKHSALDALHAVEKLVGNKQSIKTLAEETPAVLKYINDGTKLVLAWDVVVETKENMYNGIVCVDSNEVIQLIDWVSDATYNVYPLGINDPSSGSRKVIQNPEHPEASPNGWHDQDDGVKHTVTIGNNVFAQENLEGGSTYENNYRPDGGDELVFNFPLDLTKDPTEYIDTSINNLFYWNNVVHDLFYVYGFNEAAGNFQEANFNRGGAGGDSVIANAQDGSGYNNANFMTPPDGQKGRMRMYVWTQTNPRRDGDLDGGIVFHEYLHGISNRLTGGRTNVGCLGYGESGGMGEGWGDFFATITRVTENDNRDKIFEMGDYSNGGSGIRNKPYSTDMSINSWTYADAPSQWGVHGKGEIWAVFLYDIFWSFVEKHGFDADWYNVDGSNVKTSGTYRSIINGQELPRTKKTATLGGNVMFFQLVVDGMKLQPCDPTFIEARDAIIQADEINNNGENACILWTGFARRGLGAGAEYEGDESFEIPSGVC